MDSLALTGDIINLYDDWRPLIPMKVNKVLNINTPLDRAVKFMPVGEWKRLVGMEKMCGQEPLME